MGHDNTLQHSSYMQINEVKRLIGTLPDKLSIYCSDGSISRHLRARNWNVKKATKMLKDTLKWRAQYKPEEIRWVCYHLLLCSPNSHTQCLPDSTFSSYLKQVPYSDSVLVVKWSLTYSAGCILCFSFFVFSAYWTGLSGCGSVYWTWVNWPFWIL